MHLVDAPSHSKCWLDCKSNDRAMSTVLLLRCIMIDCVPYIAPLFILERTMVPYTKNTCNCNNMEINICRQNIVLSTYISLKYLF